MRRVNVVQTRSGQRPAEMLPPAQLKRFFLGQIERDLRRHDGDITKSSCRGA